MSNAQSKSSSKGRYSKEAFGEAVEEHVGGLVAQTKDAVVSGGWVYPVRGIFYLLSHPKLLQPLIPTLTTSLFIAVGVIAAMFFFTYLPQVAVLAFVSGPLAFIGAIPLVLGECYLILMFLSRNFLLGQASVDLFDAVLLSRGHAELVKKGRLISPASRSGGKVMQLGKVITKPITSRWWMSADGIVRYVLTLPLNFVPVVGTAFFLGYNGMKAGPSYHSRYFQLKGWDKQKRNDFIHKRRGAYTAFGTAAMVLNLVPVVSMFFQLTTSVGAALWAADLESKSGGSQAGETEVVMNPSSGQEPKGKKEL